MVDVDGLMSRRIGEVVAAASTSFVAQCYELYEAPPLGSFVRTGSLAVYGIVYQVTTEPLDSTRPVLARGKGVETEEELQRNNPQLSRLFTTRFEALIAGFSVGDSYKQYLPPLPPAVHSFVYTCTADEVARFTESLEFLRLLLNSGLSVADELAGACLRGAATAQGDGSAFLSRASRALAGQLSGDVPRLTAILRRVVP